MRDKRFPTVIHVIRENAGTSDEFLAVVNSDFSSLDDSTAAATYQLVDVGQVIVTREFEPKPKRRRRSSLK